MSIVIGITGGIGSGKTTVCQIIEELGYKVYYCDLAAKTLMTTTLVGPITKLFGTESYKTDGSLNTHYIASKTFGNPQALSALEAIVHPKVEEHLKEWIKNNSSQKLLFVESAILLSSQLHLIVNKSVAVIAPKELRISRVQKRDNTTVEQIEKRMSAQISDEKLQQMVSYTIICNDKKHITPQIIAIIAKEDNI